jgi:Tol biopolymer transport system component
MPEVREVYEMVTKQKQPEPGALERQQKRQVRAARNSRIAAFAVAAAIGIGAAAAILATQGQDSRPGDQPPTPATSQPVLPASSHPLLLNLRTGATTPLADGFAGGYSYVPSPDGTRIAYTPSEGGGCQRGGVTIRNLDGTGVRTLEPPSGLTYCGVRWSPDSTMLVYQQRDRSDPTDVGNLFVHDLASGRRTQITHLKLSSAWWYYLAPRFTPGAGPAFSNTTGPGNVMFHLPRTANRRTTWDVWSVPATGGEPTLLLRNAAFPVLRGQGPEGARIQFVVPNADDFAGTSLMTGRPIAGSDIRQPLVLARSSIWWPTLSPDGNSIAYQDGGSIYVLDLRTRESTKVAYGNTAEWFGTHTLVVAP